MATLSFELSADAEFCEGAEIRGLTVVVAWALAPAPAPPYLPTNGWMVDELAFSGDCEVTPAPGLFLFARTGWMTGLIVAG